MAFLTTLYQKIETLVGERIFRLIRYVFSGGTAATSNVAMLFFLVELGDMYYLYASILAFIFSLVVSFTLHKFLTFRNSETRNIHRQMGRYLVVILGNLALNTALVYLLVETTGVWYLFAQILAAVVIAVTGYIGYKYFVFREDTPRPV